MNFKDFGIMERTELTSNVSGLEEKSFASNSSSKDDGGAAGPNDDRTNETETRIETLEARLYLVNSLCGKDDVSLDW
jgi:hypothetical protein